MDKRQSQDKKSFLSKIYKGVSRLFVNTEILRERRRAEKQLEQYEFRKNPVGGQLVGVALFLALVSGIIWIVVKVFNFATVPWSQAFSAILTLGVASIAYMQWRAARQEISIDKYYDRLEVANKRLEALQVKPTPEDMYTFSELDKLEYVIVKYEHGYISPVLALRALKNFHAVCMDREGFREKAAHWVNKASYGEITRRVVKTICKDCEPSSTSQ
jgi:hypothetical protein